VEVDPTSGLLTLTVSPPFTPTESLYVHDVTPPFSDRICDVLVSSRDSSIVIFLGTLNYLETYTWSPTSPEITPISNLPLKSRSPEASFLSLSLCMTAICSISSSSTTITIVGENWGLTPWSDYPTPKPDEGNNLTDCEARCEFVTLDSTKLVLLSTFHNTIQPADVKVRGGDERMQRA